MRFPHRVPAQLLGLLFFGATPEDLCGRPRRTRECRTGGSHYVDDVRYVSGPPADPRTGQPQPCPWWHPDWPLATGAIHAASPGVPTCSLRPFRPTRWRRICLDTMGQSPKLLGDVRFWLLVRVLRHPPPAARSLLLTLHAGAHPPSFEVRAQDPACASPCRCSSARPAPRPPCGLRHRCAVATVQNARAITSP